MKSNRRRTIEGVRVCNGTILWTMGKKKVWFRMGIRKG